MRSAVGATAGFPARIIRIGHVHYAAILATFGLLALALFRDEIVGPAVYPLQLLTADVTHSLLGLIGVEAVRAEVVLFHPGGFAYEISRGCTGLVAAGFLCVSILAYPASRRLKLLGLVIGVPFLFAVNLVRLVHLFSLGAFRPERFHLAHEVIWQAVTILVLFVVWLVWTQRARAQTNSQPSEYLVHLGGRVVSMS